MGCFKTFVKVALGPGRERRREARGRERKQWTWVLLSCLRLHPDSAIFLFVLVFSYLVNGHGGNKYNAKAS